MGKAVMTDEDRAETARRLLKVFARLRDLHGSMTLQQAMALMLIASEQGQPQKAIADWFDISDGLASRHAQLLSDVGLDEIPGLDLVSMKAGVDRRTRLLFLTNKGRRFLDDIAADLGMAGDAAKTLESKNDGKAKERELSGRR
jgi:DNA-binding MarR family transcriptional regulator